MGYTDHPQVPLCEGSDILVDEGAQPLLAWLNEEGLTTVFSCQGEEGKSPWDEEEKYDCGALMFINPQTLAGACTALSNLALAAGDEDLATRVIGHCLPGFPLGPDGVPCSVEADPNQAWSHDIGWVIDPYWDVQQHSTAVGTVRLPSEDFKRFEIIIAALMKREQAPKRAHGKGAHALAGTNLKPARAQKS